MLRLDSYLVLSAVAYIIGAAPGLPLPAFASHLGSRHPWLSPVLRGLLAETAARTFIGTPISTVVAGLAVVIGASWSFMRPNRAGLVVPAAIGAGTLVSPLAAFLSGAVAFLTSRVLRPQRGASMLVPTFVGALLYPPLVWYFERFDLHLVFAVVLSLIAIYKVLPGLPPREAETPGLRRLAIFRAVMARVAVGVVLMSLLALFFFNRYVYKGFGLQVEIFRRGSDEFRLVALTFDDGPNPEYTIPILDILCDEEVPATFFLIGSEVLKYPDIARRIVDAGHEVGNHTHTHRNMFGLPAGPMQHEIDEAEKAIEAATGVRPTLFRPPRGLYDSRLVEMLRERRYTLALWSVSSRDWAEVTEASMVQRLTRIVRNGDVILFHDGGSLVSSQGGDRTNTVSALPRLIANLRQRGFSFVTLSDLILISGLTGHDADLNGGE